MDYLRCPACNSALVEASSADDSYPTINLKCKSCSNEFQFSEVIEELIEESMAGEAYIAMTDGGEMPYHRCSYCDQETFVSEEARCVACEEGLEFSECTACETTLTPDEQDNDGLCSYCNYKFQKLMRE